MKREDAEKLASNSNARNLHAPRRATVVLMLKDGSPVNDGYNVQYRLPGDEKPTIDGEYTFIVVK